MSSAWCLEVISLRLSRNSRVCNSSPLLAGTGSMITAAMSGAVFAEQPFHGSFIVEWRHQRALGKGLRHAGRIGFAEVASPDPAATSR